MRAKSPRRPREARARVESRERCRCDSSQVLDSGLHGPKRPLRDRAVLARVRSPLRLMRTHSVEYRPCGCDRHDRQPDVQQGNLSLSGQSARMPMPIEF